MIAIFLLIGPVATAWTVFWRLAQVHNRSKMGYAFLGVGMYVAALFLYIMAMVALVELTERGIVFASSFFCRLPWNCFRRAVYLALLLSGEALMSKKAPGKNEELIDSEVTGN
jgi:hypothetical protein